MFRRILPVGLVCLWMALSVSACSDMSGFSGFTGPGPDHPPEPPVSSAFEGTVTAADGIPPWSWVYRCLETEYSKTLPPPAERPCPLLYAPIDTTTGWYGGEPVTCSTLGALQVRMKGYASKTVDVRCPAGFFVPDMQRVDFVLDPLPE